MDELDFLKSHWQQDDRFPRIKAEEIRRMRHRSSSSIVKWIFIISVLEFLILGVIIPFLFMVDKKKESQLLETIYIVSDIIFYPVILYFVYRFFTSFVRIRNTTDTKTLMKAILDCRQHVHHYIQFNLYYIFVGFSIVGAAKGYEKAIEIEQGSLGLYITVFAVIMSIVGVLFALFVRLYYRVLYGILLNKLNKNYEDLLTLEQELEE